MADDFRELMFRQEELLPALRPYVTEYNGIPFVHHPLIVEPFYTPKQNAILNARFRAKAEAIAKARRQRRFGAVIALHEKPYRFDALMENVGLISNDREFWQLVADVWTGSENIYENEPGWVELLTCDRPCREAMMSDSERRKLAELPDPVAVYRGFSIPSRQQGLSWTIDRDRAVWFAQRWPAPGRTPQVAAGTVAKEHVIAYLDHRGESEIICLPEHVTVTGVSVEHAPQD